LGLAWSYDLGSDRGVEATPIVVDGIMYVTGSWSILHAIDAITGKKLWVYDPKIPPEFAKLGCCDVVNRGVAYHEGKIFLGAFDGWMHAIDAKTGKQVWKKDTFEKRGEFAYTITGAPRIIGDKVVIGNGGAEYGVRGYVTAYDVNSGKQAWRWYVVPGNPDEPFENDAMAAAAKTWDPSVKYWESGGGGTVWDSMAYDPELNLLYIGTGNGSPWNHNIRSPGGGDNLYLSSIVALNPDSGEYVWHYQGTPKDNWDYTHTQHIILADIEIDGKLRKVAMQAPKNGFFFVIDRVTGEFISAENFVEVAWATGYDKNGRPIEVPAARSITEPWEVIPSQYGAHNWHSMSYNPDTGLVYIPAQGVPLKQAPDTSYEHNTHNAGSTMSGAKWNLGYLFHVAAPEAKPFGSLIAWDPVNQKEVWRSEYISPWNGGTLTTAGNLVFQGTADGRFIAYDAAKGKKLWQVPVTTGVVAAPMTWSKNGEQYITIAVGWGGVYGLMQKATDKKTPGKVLTFKLGGKEKMPDSVFETRTTLVKGVKYKPEDVGEGLELYISNCVFCHGTPGVNNGGAVPNLGYSSKAVLNNAKNWVIDGAGVDKGMPTFKHLSETDVKKIVAFVQGTADAIRPVK
jgi:quinohemoprotein ethanol dehydrogenase